MSFTPTLSGPENERPTGGLNPGDTYFATDTGNRYETLDTGMTWKLIEPEDLPEEFAELRSHFRLLLSTLHTQANIIMPDELIEEMEKSL